MTDLVPIRKSKANQVSLADLQTILDHRAAVEETTRSPVSTKKARVEEAKRAFSVDPISTLEAIVDRAEDLADLFDEQISLDNIPLTQEQINTLSDEFYQLEQLQTHIAALESRYRELIFAHLDKTGPKIPGRPPAQVPGKVEAEGPGPHYIFERRGGNRKDPDLNAAELLKVLPPHVAAKLLVTVHHKAVEAWDETVFDEAEFVRLVDAGIIDLDLVAKYLKAGEWRTPSLYKTLVEGIGNGG